MYNDNMNCVPVCDCNEVKEPRPTLSEFLGKLEDLSNENLDLAKAIRDNLYGATPEEGRTRRSTVCCMEDCNKNIQTNAKLTNAVRVQIRERM